MTVRRDALRRFYDRLGPRQDSQWWYEDAATTALVAHAGFEAATAVFELGCGTGRFAETLLRDRLPPDACYVGVDISAPMCALARARLAAFGQRVLVLQTSGTPPFPLADGTADRFVASYVFDLLADAEIHAALADAARVLADGGRLSVAGLGPGIGPVSRTVAGVWSCIHRIAPLAVGGCRPIGVARRLDASTWALDYRDTVVACGVASEVTVATRRPRAGSRALVPGPGLR